MNNKTIFGLFVLAIIFGALGNQVSKWFHLGTMVFLGLGIYALYFKLSK